MRSYLMPFLFQISGVAALCLDRWVFHHDGEVFALGIGMLIIAMFSLPSLNPVKEK